MAHVNPKLELLKTSILKHTNNVYIPPKNIKFVKQNTNSCFTINIYTDKNAIINNANFMEDNDSENKDLFSAKSINLFFDKNKREIIDKWLNCCLEAENVTIDFFQNLMKDRIFLMHRKKVLLFVKNNIFKEINQNTKALKDGKTDKDYNSNIQHLNKTIINIDQKIATNNSKFLEALKNEKIYWLDIDIKNMEKICSNIKPLINEYTSLRHIINLNEKDAKYYKFNDLLNYFKDLKKRLLSPTYFKETSEKIKDLLINLKIFNSIKNESKNKFANMKISNEIKKINTEIKKIKYEHVPHFNFKNVRSILHEKLTNIIERSNIFNKNETKIKKHILDESVKQVCANLDSMLANYNNGNIKSFKLKKRKMNKTSKNLILEKEFFKKGSIFKKIFQNIKCEKDGKPYNIFETYDKKTSCNLVYNDDTKTYKLFVPEKITKKETKNVKSFSGDFGIRVFITGISENEIIEIGKSSEMEIKNMVIKLRELKNFDTKIRNKKKKITKLRKDIANKVDELHWKTIKFITNNYGTVIVGDINVKSIVRKDGNLSEMNKDLIHALSIYKFKQRLKYKCRCMGLQCLMPDEYGTSKLCSCCGDYNDVKDSKIYKCKSCKSIMVRDINSARSIKMLKMM